MRILEKTILCNGKSDVFEFYPIGDIHIGARHCAEKPLKQLLNSIPDNGYIIGGGDWLDAIKPQDSKRFDMDTFPDWMLDGDANTTREKLNDILIQQIDRTVEIFEPHKMKIIGILEGNHEYTIRKYYNENIIKAFCRRLGVEDLTDETFIRLRFKRKSGDKLACATVKLYIRHGYGGGRTAGAEPNKLFRMLAEWEDADICLTGHSHTFDVLPPKPVLYIPTAGTLPKEFHCKYRWAANWGCWLYSHPAGASSYSSRACYPARPMLTVKAVIKPFNSYMINGEKKYAPHIELRGIPIN